MVPCVWLCRTNAEVPISHNLVLWCPVVVSETFWYLGHGRGSVVESYVWASTYTDLFWTIYNFGARILMFLTYETFQSYQESTRASIGDNCRRHELATTDQNSRCLRKARPA